MCDKYSHVPTICVLNKGQKCVTCPISTARHKWQKYVPQKQKGNIYIYTHIYVYVCILNLIAEINIIMILIISLYLKKSHFMEPSRLF